ncbi:MAG: hypothetical protein ABR874_22605 [Candidatus Sulfotelmatobacter sp.]|jgi:hypothetical protein
MRSSEPTLRIDFIARGNPACSLCGMPFGSEGMTRTLIDAFALHVRRQHFKVNENSSTTRKPLRQYSLRNARRV